MRRVLLLIVMLVVAAGCGQQSPRGSQGADPTASPTSAVDTAAGQHWLLRFDSYVGEDGEGRRASYVDLVPETGAARVVHLPTVEPMQVSGHGVSLLVDAGHRWALADNQPSARQRARGSVRLYDLAADGAQRVLSVRLATGQPTLRTDWVSFDPTAPNVLRVVSGRQVWKVDVATSQAQQDATLPSRTGWIYAGGFDANSGLPYIEDTGSFDTDPPGNGDDKATALTRQGGTVLDADADTPYGTAPSPCEVSAGYIAAAGDTWAFCVADRSIHTRVLDKGATSWRDVGTATGAVVPVGADPVFALPPP